MLYHAPCIAHTVTSGCMKSYRTFLLTPHHTINLIFPIQFFFIYILCTIISQCTLCTMYIQTKTH